MAYPANMQVITGPRSKRHARQRSSTQYYINPAYVARQLSRKYPWLMPTQIGKGGTPEQREFGKWVSLSLAYLEEVRGLSLRDVAKRSGISHTQIYRWMGRPEAKGYSDAQSESVRQFCYRLKLDYNEAAYAAGWTKEPPPAPRDAEGFIRRARAMADHPDTTEEDRRDLLARIETAEYKLRAAREMERSAEDDLRKVLEERDPGR
jgi:transcriptional regulator with XRE-family HTH domain